MEIKMDLPSPFRDQIMPRFLDLCSGPIRRVAHFLGCRVERKDSPWRARGYEVLPYLRPLDPCEGVKDGVDEIGRVANAACSVS